MPIPEQIFEAPRLSLPVKSIRQCCTMLSLFTLVRLNVTSATFMDFTCYSGELCPIFLFYFLLHFLNRVHFSFYSEGVTVKCDFCRKQL